MNSARETGNKTSLEPVLYIVFVAFVLCYYFFFNWDLSLLKIIITAVVISAFLVRWKSIGKIRKYLETLLIAVMAFAIILSGIRWASFITFSISFKTSYPGVLDQSLKSLIEEVRRSPAFGLVLFEHCGKLSFESLEFISFGNSVEIKFFSEVDHMTVTLRTSGSTLFSESYFGGTSFSRVHNQSATSEELLFQIDEIGLRWFHDNAVQALQNKVGHVPSFDGVGFKTYYETLADYDGLAFYLFGTQKESDGRGASSVWFAKYLPNGTLLSAYLSY